ncbi:hypothetical protein GJV26_28870 [Massilia dura]|uniref:Proteinase inhibitor I42 chagasin domain-containing protein n=1 Tax=Pseudoduganella dura TaxID=321982 RepID=A0A6I3XPB5_9BURK|nr:protease inhibitor I42 family protein [Pseudoduganella dura]MUI16440.1 hypothetical protein [Pseudoduganella dura]GGX86803.1 hypothetical protein GCM10007386_17080 [Pseudoduganella dura]
MTRQRPALTIAADRDGKASVALPEAPATGYRWELEDAALACHVAAATFAEEEGKAPGGAGNRVFSLDLQGRATLELVFILKRGWRTEALERQGVTVSQHSP